MKKMTCMGLAVLMLGFLSTACFDQLTPVAINQVEDNKGDLHSFTATIESDATKTTLNGLSIVWSTGDKIKVYNADNPSGKIYVLSSSAGSSTGTFTAESEAISGSGPYYAIYPAEIANGSLPSITADVPGTQTYVEGSFGAGANIAAAADNNLDNLQFHNLGGILKLTIKGSKTIKAINLYTRGTDVFQGRVSVSDPLNPILVYPAFNGTNGTVSLDCGSGVSLTDAGKDFYFVLPTGTMLDGFQAEIIDSEGMAMIKNAPADTKNMITRSQIRPMPAFTYEQQYNSNFLLSASEAGVWTDVKTANTSLTAVQQYIALDGGQYALTDPTASSHTQRFQNWSIGYSVSMTVTNTMTLSADNVTVSVTKLGASSVATPSNLPVKVIKQFGGRNWLVAKDGNGGDGYGYIVR